MSKAYVSPRRATILIRKELSALGLPAYRLTASARTGVTIVRIHDFVPDVRLAYLKAFADARDFEIEVR